MLRDILSKTQTRPKRALGVRAWRCERTSLRLGRPAGFRRLLVVQVGPLAAICVCAFWLLRTVQARADEDKESQVPSSVDGDPRIVRASWRRQTSNRWRILTFPYARTVVSQPNFFGCGACGAAWWAEGGAGCSRAAPRAPEGQT